MAQPLVLEKMLHTRAWDARCAYVGWHVLSLTKWLGSALRRQRHLLHDNRSIDRQYLLCQTQESLFAVPCTSRHAHLSVFVPPGQVPQGEGRQL